jgi:DNA repair protein RadC
MVKYPMPSNAPTVYTAPASSGTHVAAQSEHAYEGTVRAALLKLGANDPDADTAATNDFWRHCMQLGIAPEVTASVIYSTARHRHAGTSTLKEASEAPTREEWEVIARRQGPMEKLLNAAGRKATAVEGNLVIFGDFYDDEAARSFAQTLTKAGYIVTYGPHKVPEAAENSAEEAPRRGDPDAKKAARIEYKRLFKLADEADAVAKATPNAASHKIAEDAARAAYNAASLFYRTYGGTAVHDAGQVYASYLRFHQFKREELEKAERAKQSEAARAYSTSPEYRAAQHIKNAELAADMAHRARHYMTYMPGTSPERAHQLEADYTRQAEQQYELARSCRGEIVQPKDKAEEVGLCEGDASAVGASEVAPVISEAKGNIPWAKVERNPQTAEAAMELASKYGPIGSATKVYEVVGHEFEKEDQEVFIVIPLNLRGELKSPPIEIARGQRSHVAVGVNDVMRAVLQSGCEGFFVAHGHPTGRCTPSKADRDLTNQIKAATVPFGREVKYLDHFVVGRRQIYSIEEGKAYKIK